MRSSTRDGGVALLLIDFINPLDFDGGERFAPRALKAAQRTAKLKARVKARGVPAIYANDNFGDWRAEFNSIVESCIAADTPGCALSKVLRPEPDDLSVLKPRHSAFYGTPLEFMLDELKVRRLILTGLAADVCVLFTAHDAYLRKFELWIPADCVASERDADRLLTLDHVRRKLKARTAASTSKAG